MPYQINITPDGLKTYPLHKHGGYEVMLYLAGEGILATEMGDVPFRAGSIVIVPPGISHGSLSKNGFKNISVEGDFSPYFCFDEVKKLSDSEKKEGERLATLLFDSRYESDTYLSHLAAAYALFLSSHLRREDQGRRELEEVFRAISDNAHDPDLRPSLFLKQSGYSEDYARALFKTVTGKTPTEYLTDLRIRHARFLIDVYGDVLSLSEIAYRCGYLDYIHFSKKFKSLTGLSPREYKSSVRNGVK